MPRPLTQTALPGQLGALAILVLAGARVTRTMDDARIAELTGRIGALENERATHPAAAGMTIRAPFTVTDANGKPILEVLESLRGLQVSNASGSPQARVTANPDGAAIFVRSPDNKHHAVISGTRRGASFNVRDGMDTAAVRVEMRTDSAGAPLITLTGAKHGEVVRIGEDSLGGQLLISNAQQQAAVVAYANNDGGAVKVLNPKKTRVAVFGVFGNDAALSLRDGLTTDRIKLALASDGSSAFVLLNSLNKNVFTITEGSRHDGMFQISDRTGLPMVEGGVTANNHGVVRVGPAFNCGGKMGLFASDCIVGHDP